MNQPSTMIADRDLVAHALKRMAIWNVHSEVWKLPGHVVEEVGLRLLDPAINAASVARWLRDEGHNVIDRKLYRFAVKFRRAAEAVHDAVLAGVNSRHDAPAGRPAIEHRGSVGQPDG